MVKIRLSRKGSKKRPFYQIVIADSRCSRNGRFIEKIGFFNPLLSSQNNKDVFHNISINMNRIEYWISNGALMSKRVKHLIKCKNKISNENH